MKKLFIIIFLLFVLFVTYVYFNFLPIRKTVQKVSFDLKQSKKRGTYLFEYNHPDVIKLNDTLSFTINNCYAEKQFFEFEKKTILEGDSNQIVVRFKEDFVTDGLKKPSWRFKGWKYVGKSIYKKYNGIPLPDSITIEMYWTKYRSSELLGKIGEFTIDKKNIPH
ncbi:hypothetical protein [Aureibacter tunicatorum]|uniref:C-di-AMP phosphodiesterase-like protein n=1 Tax=Aureibacter tunicatorum TaxID=866807 RepID=A0AAE3XQY3_9BACT|nr:hypothetical protein [Aureibacter tunicatorum]MDR6241517.1 c-di-AMP phosphodiesterase-like protein [Aureibacter tunicatorum]BDD07025.1 hypothetical protein AUTU_45080 [Aureibacter tunicatorum]